MQQSGAALFRRQGFGVCLLRLAEKAFRPGVFPFPLMHIDTGHNYQEVIAFRDKRAAELGERLIVRSLEDSMARQHRPQAPARVAQQAPVGDPARAIEEFGFDACIGGARRDEEARARADHELSRRVRSVGPQNQRPELWNLFNARTHRGENIRAFPISNWTELDVWRYIQREQLELPSIYFAHTRPVVRKNGLLQPVTELTRRAPEQGRRGAGALSHRRRHQLHRAGRVRRRHPRQDPRRDRHHHDHRTRRHPHGRPDLGSIDGATQEEGYFWRVVGDSGLESRTNARRCPRTHHQSRIANYRTHERTSSPRPSSHRQRPPALPHLRQCR